MIITYSGPNCSKLNKVVSKHNVKTSVLKYGKYIDILAEKMWVAFAWQKLLTFLQQKYLCIWKYFSYNS